MSSNFTVGLTCRIRKEKPISNWFFLLILSIQSSSSWTFLLQAIYRHCQQSPGVYNARPGRLGLGRDGDGMADPQRWKGQWRSLFPTSLSIRSPRSNVHSMWSFRLFLNTPGQWGLLPYEAAFFICFMALAIKQHCFIVYGALPPSNVYIHSSQLSLLEPINIY